MRPDRVSSVAAERSCSARAKRALALLALAAAASAPPLAAQNYPVKPVRMVVPVAAGGPVDTVARLLAFRLSEQLGQQVYVENRPGAGGSVGGDIVARSAPDGYTLLMASNGTIAIAPHLLKLPYDAARDLAPVSLAGTSPQVLVVHPSLPVRSVRELVAIAKAKPGMLNFGSAGQGATSHLAGELFKVSAGIDIVHVPYKGAGPALNDLVAGQTQMMVTGVSSALPFIQAGRLRALGVTSTRRLAVLPGVPAIAEALPGYEVTTWYGVFTRAGAPESVTARLHQELARTLASPEVKAKLAALGVESEPMSPAEFGAMITRETAKWGALVKKLGITPQ
jgi:tripartite-type tricarboxylate transporter receptor subunit TctC